METAAMESLKKEIYIKELELSVIDQQIKLLQVDFTKTKSQYDTLVAQKEKAESAPPTKVSKKLTKVTT